MADNPFDPRNVSGSHVVQACDTMNFTEPTSVVMIVSRGERSRRSRVTSYGERPFTGGAEGRNTRVISSRRPRTSSLVHSYGPSGVASRPSIAAPGSPTTSCSGLNSPAAIDIGPIDTMRSVWCQILSDSTGS